MLLLYYEQAGLASKDSYSSNYYQYGCIQRRMDALEKVKMSDFEM